MFGDPCGMVAGATRSRCARNTFLRAAPWRPFPLRGFHSARMTMKKDHRKVICFHGDPCGIRTRDLLDENQIS